MKSRQTFLGANWKMHGNRAELEQLFRGFQQLAVDLPQLNIVVFPPYVYLPMLIAEKSPLTPLYKRGETNQSPQASLCERGDENILPPLAKGGGGDFPCIAIGAQNQADHLQGAYTGEISPLMLQDIGCEYVLLGHSERRHLYGETNEMIADKFALALECHLKPVLCIGETQSQRDAHETGQIVKHQLDVVINQVGIHGFDTAVIAYEPVWAIGTGRTPTLDEIQSVHTVIRQHLAKQNAALAAKIQIIYGGSLKPDNAKAILALSDVDGGLIGGASLKLADFKQICLAAE